MWEKALSFIRQNVTKQTYSTWFAPIVFLQFDSAKKAVYLKLPSHYFYEYLEEHFVDLLSKALGQYFCPDIHLYYSVVTDKEHHLSQEIEGEKPSELPTPQQKQEGNKGSKGASKKSLQPLDSQLNPKLTFSNFIEGKSNMLPRSLGLNIAEHPNSAQFNPMFIYGPSGCGKTHLINAIGVHAMELYPQKRVLYISARLFQVQYTNAVLHNQINDFIGFYQTIDILIVDDIQEWINSAKTQETFFHIFDHLFRNGKRIILASDRPPVDLEGMPERLLTRFSCGLIAELEKPNEQLCIDILESKIQRDGLQIPADVVRYIARTANGSVRDLEGVVISLMAYSIVYNSKVDLRLAERVIQRAVKTDNRPLTLDDIIEKVCQHFEVTVEQIKSKSRKRDYVVARQVSMYLAHKYTKMPASRIGKLVGNRDHSTVIHSCAQVERRMRTDRDFSADLQSIEHSFGLKSSQD